MKCGPEFVNKNGDRHNIFSLLHKKPNNKALHRTATAELFNEISNDIKFGAFNQVHPMLLQPVSLLLEQKGI